MTSIVSSVAWIIIALLFLILFWHSWRIYNSLEKKRKNGDFESRGFESNASEMVKILSVFLKELVIASMLACIVSIVAALLPIFV
jgi:hypothetical protein